VYAPLLNQIRALSLDVIWGFETTSISVSKPRLHDNIQKDYNQGI